MKRVVQLTTYPLRSPRHGGQLRCAAIRARYREAGVDVRTIAAMHEDAYRGERDADDIGLPAGLAGWNPMLSRFTDVQTGDVLAGDERSFREFASRMTQARPDAIQLEQPWLYPAARRWLDECLPRDAPRPLLVYSSQNIEWKLKRDEMPADCTDPRAYAREVARVEALEKAVVAAADLVVACTDEELAQLRAVDDSPTRRGWVTAHNAIAPFAFDAERVAAMQRRLGLHRYPLFVGSAHPPNVEGFWQMLAPSLAFLRPGEKIIVAGGVGHLLRQHRRFLAWNGINESRLAVLGELPHEDLVSLLGGAHAILLPITTGGGSNLKTAEAIYSGRPVLATPHALRGYGDAGRWPTITVAADADTFRRALRGLLDRPVPPPPPDHAQRRDEVTWAHTLAPLAQAVAKLRATATR